MKTKNTARTFLGDALYYSHDGTHVRLATSDGTCDLCVVYMDDRVLLAFLAALAADLLPGGSHHTGDAIVEALVDRSVSKPQRGEG